MTERNRPIQPNERNSPLAQGGGTLTQEAPGNVRVTHGVLSQIFAIAGRTVQAARELLRVPLAIDPTSQAYMEGQPIDDSTVLQANQTLSFIRRAGEKGARP